MNVVIVGAGEVGRTVAETLTSSHDVVVVDTDRKAVDELTYEHNVLAIHGDGTVQDNLHDAGVTDADMVIACTDDDEVNLVICGTVKSDTDVFTIARVRRHSLLEVWQGSRAAFGVDYMVCTDRLTAEAIVRIADMPGAQTVESFAGGLIRMAEFDVPAGCSIAGRPIRELDRDETLTFAAVYSDDAFTVATGDRVITGGDRIVVIGSPEAVERFAADLRTVDDDPTSDIVIVGGSEIGIQTAHRFEEQSLEPRIIEPDPVRARAVAEALPNSLVLEHDGTDQDFLEREHVGEADLVITAIDDDATNLLIALLAGRLGVDRTIAVIESSEYAELFEAVGIDVAVNPRQKTADEIVRFTREDHTVKLTMLEDASAEVVELTARSGGILTDQRIEDAVARLPDGVVIGAISRGGELVPPRGGTVVRRGDHLVLFVDESVIETVLEAV